MMRRIAVAALVAASLVAARQMIRERALVRDMTTGGSRG